jgi:mannosyltransferase OCH1-like enzyme
MNIYPLGNWNETAKNIILKNNNTLECELKKINGTYVYNKLIFNKNSIYENHDGIFKIVGTNIDTNNFIIPDGTWIKSARNIINKKDEDSKDEDSKDEDSKDEDSKDEDSKDEDSKDEDSKDEDSKDEDSKDEDSKDEDSKDEDSKDEDSKDEDSKDEDSKDEDLEKEYEITAELKDSKGNYKFNIIKFSKNDTVSNIDGAAFVYKKKYDKILDCIHDIPKKIFQTHKNFNYMINKQKTKKSHNSWNQYKDFEYNFYTDEDCEQFIKNNFDENTYKAYMKCPIPVMKADLWRYCIIYKYGGIYADADTVCLKDPSIFLEKRSYLVCIPENNVHLCNWIFAAPEGSPILKSIIDLSVERILNNFEKKQHMVHYYTGPGVFTDGIEIFLKEKDLITFFSNRLLYSYPYKNYWLHVFDNHIYFHNNIINHLNTGSDRDGWENMIKNYINS